MDTARLPSNIDRRKRIDCSLTSNLLMETLLLAFMEFADGTLSVKRGCCLKRFPGFDSSRFDLFRHGVTYATVE